MFLPRLCEFAIEVKGKHGKTIRDQRDPSKPHQDVFAMNYLNLAQYLRKRE